MENRVPTKPGRIKLTDDSGNVKYYYMERADEPTTEGTPLNKATLFDAENEERYGCDLPSEAFGLLTKEWSVKLTKGSWSKSGNYYVQTKSISDMKAAYCPRFTSDDTDFSMVYRMVTSEGSVKFYAKAKPTTDITIRILGV